MRIRPIKHGGYRAWRPENKRISRMFLESAFTIPEAMMASLVLALVLVTTLQIISHCTKYVDDMRVRARSSQILQQKLEDLRLLDWDSMQTAAGTFTVQSDASQIFSGRILSSPYQSYAGDTTVLRVTAQLVWLNKHQKQMTNTMSTLISNGGLNRGVM